MHTLLLTASLLGLALTASTVTRVPPDAASQWQKAYPAAAKGMKRIVIHLEAKPDEFAWKVELSVGRTMETDGVNRIGGGARLTEKTVEGWGYNYFEARATGPMFSTLIGVSPDQPKVTRFVTMAETGLVRYNSNLPVIVYVPADMEVRYRLWQAEPEARKGDEG
ncbi:MAG: proteinase inhibitor I4 serpin [Verrucomicrobia bacterium]|nr:proteinase inhibitor I4 serpin [Verrucomicrobiota bacterium]